MTIAKKTILFIIITLYSFASVGQNQNYISDSIRAVDLHTAARQLFQDELYTQSLDSFKLALELRKKLWGVENEKLASTYSALGIVYGRLGQLDMALQNYQLAESNYLLAKNFPARSMVSLFINIGIVYRFKLDYQKALQYYNQALSMAINNLNGSKEEIAEINYTIAELYYLIDDYDKALKIVKENIKMAYIEDQLLYFELLAFINQQKGNLTEAKKNYTDLIDLTIDMYGKNDIEVAIASVNYANFLISNNDFNEAQQALDRASRIYSLHNLVNGILYSEYCKNRAMLEDNKPVETRNLTLFKNQKKENLEKAIEWYRKSLQSLEFPEDYTPEEKLETGDLLSVNHSLEILKLMADNYDELSRLEQNSELPVFNTSMERAIETYRIIGSIIQQARRQLSDDESKIQLTALEYSTFQKIIQISYTAYSITKDPQYLEMAFRNTERIKGSSVFDKVSDQLALDNSVVPDSILNLEKKLNQTIAIYTNKLHQEQNAQNPDSVLLSEYTNQIFNNTRDRDELNRFIESEYSDFYELKYSNSLLTAREIQDMLPENQAIVEYVINEIDDQSELYTFIIQRDEISFRKQMLEKDFDRHVENMFHFMSSNEYMFTKNSDSKQFCVSSTQLYKSLIEPIQYQIRNKKITIIPDGKLSYVPFDALLVTLPDTSDLIEFNKLDYLIKTHCINYSNSANLLFAKRSEGKKTNIRALLFAPEYKEGETIEIGQKEYPLVQLPGVQKEVTRISKIIDSEIFVGENATEENFRKNVEKFDILHLAMHAFINDSLPAFSSFAFTRNDSEDPTKNGLLNTTDIYSLKLNADMAVLSACNTGTGRLQKGEGIMSLARGFMYAGCPTIIMSLWEVEDESGTRIMSSFYKNIKKGKDRDESLRQAKLEYLETVNSRRAHPHYWLGFVSIGDNSPLYVSYDFYFFVVLLLALTGIGIDQVIRIRKARQRRAS
jgi:CHAT domain-containing protein/tetratricopeptide (TPR) repeat protein